MKAAIVEADDLTCHEQLDLYAAPLHDAVPHLVFGAYAIPNHLGPVHELKKLYPWVRFYLHGLEHVWAECRSWSSALAQVNLELGLNLGYEPIFKPPQWICHEEIEEACKAMDVVLHHHLDYVPTTRGLLCYPGPKALRKRDVEYIHTHIVENPATDFIVGHEKFTPEFLAGFDTFLTPRDAAVRIP